MNRKLGPSMIAAAANSLGMGRTERGLPTGKRRIPFLILSAAPTQRKCGGLEGGGGGFLSPQARATEQEHQIGVDSSRKTSREVTGREASWGAEDRKVGGPAGARAVSARSCSCQPTLSRHTKSQRQRPQPLGVWAGKAQLF